MVFQTSQLEVSQMQVLVEIDEELLARVWEYTGPRDVSALVREALTDMVARHAAKRLAALGGSEPDLKPIRRRRAAGR
jgi:Arc/MetJ family transcription regulator